MPSLYFKVESDVEKVIKLREEIKRLKEELAKMGADTASDEIKDFERRLQACRSEMDRNIKSLVSYNNSLRASSDEIASVSNALSGKLAKGLSVIGGMATLKELATSMIKVRGEFQSADTAIQTLLGNKEKADQLMAKVRKYATVSPLEFSDVTKATQMMLGFNIEAEKVPRYLQAIGDVSMGDTARFNSLTLAFSQMSAAGKLMGQDLNQMINAGFNPLQTISEKTGKGIANLKDEMSKGAISAEMVQQAFIDATSAGGKFYQMSENAAKTINGQISMLQDSWAAMLNNLGKESEGMIISGIQSVTKLISNYEQIGKVIAELVVTYGVYKASLIAIMAIEKAHKAVMEQAALEMSLAAKESQVLSNAQAVATAKTKLLQAAQMGLVRSLKAMTAAMTANPYVLMAAAVAALGLGIYKLATYQTESEKAQKRLNKSFQEFQVELGREKASVDSLFSSLKKSNEGTEERAKLIKAVNEQYGQYLPHLLTEKSNLNEINTAYNIINDSLRDSIALKMRNQAVDTAATNGLTKQMEALDKARGAMASKGVNGAVSELLIGETQDIIKSARDAGKTWAEAYNEASMAVLNKLGRDRLKGSGFYTYLQDYTEAYYETEQEIEQISNRFNAVIFSERKGETKQEAKKNVTSLSDELKKATEQAAKLNKEIADLRSGKPIELKEGESIADRIEAKQKELKAVEDTIATLTGQTEKQRTKSTEEDMKRQRELNSEIQTLLSERTQLEISLMQEGAAKKEAEIEADYDSEIAKIRQKEQEWKDEQKGGLTQGQADYVTEALRQAADKRLKLLGQLNEETAKAERDAYTEYLAQYGEYAEKRMAIEEQYRQRMAEAETEGERLSLQKEMEKEISDLDYKQFEKSIEWDKIFGNLNSYSKSALDALRKQIENYINAHKDLDPENLKVLRERLIELERESNNADKLTLKVKKFLDLFKNRKEGQRGLLSKEQMELASSMANDIDKITGVANASLDLADTLGIKLPEGMDQAIKGFDGISSGFKDIASGNMVSGAIKMIGGAINMFAGLGKTMTSIFGSSNTEWIELNDQYQRLVDVWGELIDRKKEYLSQSWGSETNAISSEIQDLYEAQQVMAKTVAEARLKYRLAGDHSVGYNMWNGRKEYEGYAWKDIAGEIQKALGIAFNSQSDLIKLATMTDEQYEWIMKTYPQYIAMLDEEFRDSLDDIHSIGNAIEDLTEQTKEQLTSISFDTLESDFLSSLMDMDLSAEEFAGNFEKYMQQAIMNTLVAEKYRAKLQKWYDTFASDSEDGINADEYKELQQQYSAIVEEAVAERDRLKELMGWATDTEETTSDNSLKGAYAKASQESIDLLAGQAGAQRVLMEDIKAQLIPIQEQMRAIYALQQKGWDDVNAIRQLMTQVRQLSEQVASYTYSINDRMGDIKTYSKRSADALESTLNVKVKL